MIIKFEGLLENIDSYTGKNGFGAGITVSQKNNRKTSRLEFRTKDEENCKKWENYLDEFVIVEIELKQNNFGLQFGDVYKIERIPNQKQKNE